MKIRNGFVSNSSSSSFVVIDAKNGYSIPLRLQSPIVYIDNRFGTSEFGWGSETIEDGCSRIIFAYLQIYYDDNNEQWLEMLEEVIKENTPVKEIVWKINTEYAYIDHQSNAAEGQNTEIFDSKERLKDFIFGKDSKIVLDNDNH